MEPRPKEASDSADVGYTKAIGYKKHDREVQYAGNDSAGNLKSWHEFESNQDRETDDATRADSRDAEPVGKISEAQPESFRHAASIEYLQCNFGNQKRSCRPDQPQGFG